MRFNFLLTGFWGLFKKLPRLMRDDFITLGGLAVIIGLVAMIFLDVYLFWRVILKDRTISDQIQEIKPLLKFSQTDLNSVINILDERAAKFDKIMNSQKPQLPVTKSKK